MPKNHEGMLPERHASGAAQQGGRPSFRIEQLDYDLPEELIAQEPAAERGTSRLLVVDRAAGSLTDSRVGDFPDYLRDGDAIVLNDTRVVPARFDLFRATGGRIEALFLVEHAAGEWDVLLKGAQKLRIGERLEVGSRGGDFAATIASFGERGRARLTLTAKAPAGEVLRQFGRMPLPPYIRRSREGDVHDAEDRERYQTVYAQRDGAVAAPTAGLHFTPQMLQAIEQGGARIANVTLHVGYGTFAPIETDDLAAHPMHAEWFDLSQETADLLGATRSAGGRIVAVGTTSARVLECAWRQDRWAARKQGWTDLFCYPPYAFGGIDALFTNFHLPRSTLLALVMAFAGIDLTRRAYAHAIAQRYRFYSYGDAMLIL